MPPPPGLSGEAGAAGFLPPVDTDGLQDSFSIRDRAADWEPRAGRVTALDEGKTSLSWLLTSLPEPNFSQVQLTRACSSIKPFSRLCNPSWIAANVG